MAIIKYKDPEAFQFTGDNYDELKNHFPALEKYTFRGEEELRRNVPDFDQYKFEGYTVGWATEHGFTEALPGFYLVKDGGDFILELHVFEETYQS